MTIKPIYKKSMNKSIKFSYNPKEHHDFNILLSSYNPKADHDSNLLLSF